MADRPSPGARGRAPASARRAPGRARIRLRTRAPTALCAFLLACGGDGTGPSDPGPSAPNLAHLSLFPDRWTGAVGDAITLQVGARTLSGADTSGVTPTYTVSDASVASVDAHGRVAALKPGTATVRATAGGQTAETTIHVGAATYDLATLGPPRVLSAAYIDLSKITRISRFRSTVGHSYVDASGETCRSMKHYFQPLDSIDWTTVDEYAPVSGTIWHLRPDGAWGQQVLLRPKDMPALQVALFHVQVDSTVVQDMWVEAGQHIGRHSTSQTTSDIAVSIGGKEAGTLLSYFETMTDALFAQFQARGVPSREAAIITKEERDADAVPCTGEQQFLVHGTLPDWLDLS